MKGPYMKRPGVVISIVGALSFVLIAVLVAGCGGNTNAGSSSDDSKSLEGTLWQATEIAGVKSVSTKAGESSTAKFSGGKLAGSGAVNTYTAAYTTGPGNTIEIGAPVSTMMAGPQAAMDQETAYFAAIQKAATYKVDSKSLTLLDKDGATLVKYQAIAEAALIGTQWEATAYNNGKGALQSLAPDTSITAEFADNGDMQGNATINQYTAAYTYTADGKMTISDKITSTKMAGPDASMAQESAYLAALPKTASYTIDGNKLTLRDASGAALAEYVAKGSAK
jgi:heat shock protein HslJ